HLNINGLLDNTGGTLMATTTGGSTAIIAQQLDNTRGTVAANGSGLAMTTGTLTNTQGNILQAGAGLLQIDATMLSNSSTDLQANGRIISNGAIDLNLTSALHNSGLISAAQVLDIAAPTITNSGRGLLGSRNGAVVIDATTLTNSATISGATATELTTTTLNNRDGTIQSDGTVTINTNQLTTGTITGQAILATVSSNLTIGSQEQLQATHNLVLNTSGSLTNSGSIISGNQLQLSSSHLTNQQSGVIKAGNRGTVTTGTLTNLGT
ncbi:hypothetical protein QE250_16940, partial [Chromatiaceae bacterium AAb-1]|nr:hypothetical protein [Chromatiaceae bacterium AAb-1]